MGTHRDRAAYNYRTVMAPAAVHTAGFSPRSTPAAAGSRLGPTGLDDRAGTSIMARLRSKG